MQKYRNTEIKSFEFSDLKADHVISQTKFQSFEFKNLTGESINSLSITEEEIRDERKYEKNNNFKIDGIVRDYRGLSRQEQNDLEEKIQIEVRRRLETAYQDAYKEGLEKGKAEGQEIAQSEFSAALSQKVEKFEKIIEEVQAHSQKLIEKNHHEIYDFVKRFTKWVILKEIDEKTYLTRLLEKLILEMNARKNLIIKVGKSNFSHMPEVIQLVEGKIGNLSNVRIEIVPEINHPGIILESENGLIDGSLEGIFENIDKIFEQVVKHE